ncbi:Uncharacterised protein [Vibrio cholerae]|nr:Uncharacterised protein [Vibrio cholerae]
MLDQGGDEKSRRTYPSLNLKLLPQSPFPQRAHFLSQV